MKTLISLRRLLPALALATFVTVQPGGAAEGDKRHGAGAEVKRAIAVLSPAEGSDVSGTVKFAREKDGVRVTVEVTGLQPNSEHGFHVHEKGDLSAADLTSAGGHFNPTGHPHAGRDARERHIGDLGNLRADAQGRAQTEFVDRKLALEGANSIVGRAVIIHAGRDDLQSQPTGDSGARVAGGVIGIIE